MSFLMQARDSTTGLIVTWLVATTTPDFAGADYPGDGDPEEIAATQFGSTGTEDTSSNLPDGICTPEMFGATTDNATHQDAFDAAAAAIEAGTYSTLWMSNRSYLLPDGYEAPEGSMLRGNGARSVIVCNENVSAIRGNENDITLMDFRVECDFSGSTQIGVALGTTGVANSGPIRAIVDRVTVYHAAGKAFAYVKNPLAGGVYSGPMFSHCNADLCEVGFYIGERGEYATFTGCQSSQCTKGFLLDAGNFTITGGSSSGDTYGFYISPGVNDGHGSVTGVLINHSTNRSVYVGAIVNGVRFCACMIYSDVGEIECAGSSGVTFNQCDVDVQGMICSGATPYSNGFHGCTWPGAYDNTISDTGSEFFYDSTNRDLATGSLPILKPDLRGRLAPVNATALVANGNQYRVVYSWIPDKIRTTDATPTVIMARTLKDEAASKVVAEVTATKSDGSVIGDWTLKLSYKRDGGAVTEGTLDTGTPDSGFATAAPTLTHSGTSWQLVWTGEGGLTVDVTATITLTECKHA